MEEDIEKVIWYLKRFYLYPSYADVELDPRFERILKNAKKVKVIPEGDTVRILVDGEEYLAGIEDEVSFLYHEASEDEQKAVLEEAKQLKERFEEHSRKPEYEKKGKYYFIIENENPDGYESSICTL